MASSSQEKIYRGKEFTKLPIPSDTTSKESRYGRARPSKWEFGVLSLILILAGVLAVRQQPRRLAMQPPATFSAGWWLQPIEVNAAARMTTLADVRLRDIACIRGDDGRVWAAGDSGLILYSDDGGRTWERSTLEPILSQGSMPRFERLPTDDAPQQNELDTSQQQMEEKFKGGMPPNFPEIRNVSMDEDPPNDLNREALERVRIVQIEFGDTLAGYAFGYAGEQGKSVLLRTRDGGRSWSPATLPQLDDGGSLIAVADASTVWMFNAGILWWTINGGDSWRETEDITEFVTDDIKSFWAGKIAASPTGGLWVLSTNFSQSSILHVFDRPGELARGITTPDYLWLDFELFDNDSVLLFGVSGMGIAFTDDGGATWQTSPVSEDHLWGNADHIDRQRVWVLSESVNNDNTLTPNFDFPPIELLYTADGGQTWATACKVFPTYVDYNTYKTYFGPRDDYLSIVNLLQYCFATEDVGWAVFDPGVILGTIDGGKSWSPLTRTGDDVAVAGAYYKLPAPWFFVLCVVTPCFMLLARHTVLLYVRRRREQELKQDAERRQKESGASIVFASDKPLEPGEASESRLGMVARALIRFLSNRNTAPPLTLAISGPWGSGKSSLMNLVRHGLREHGYWTVWFNAWHHQKEEHLFAALLENVRSQAAPRIDSLRSFLRFLGFKWRLLWIRLRRRWVAALFWIVALGTLYAYIASDSASRSKQEASVDTWVRNNPEAAARLALGLYGALDHDPEIVSASVLLSVSDAELAPTAQVKTPEGENNQSNAAPPTNGNDDHVDQDATTNANGIAAPLLSAVDVVAARMIADEKSSAAVLRRLVEVTPTDEAHVIDLIDSKYPGPRPATAIVSRLLTDLSRFTDLSFLEALFAFILTALLPLTRVLKTFGVNTGALLASESRNASVGKLRQQSGIRHRFAREFQDVLRASGSARLIIFIDDLDRCREENVLDVLETVNFLVSSGDCIVLMGMDRKQVQACVGLAFKDIATEVLLTLVREDDEDESETVLDEPPQVVNPAAVMNDRIQEGRKQRAEYAHQYLKKLVNVELAVPTMSAEESAKLVQTAKRDTVLESRTRGRWNALAYVGVAAMLTIGIWIGAWQLGQAGAPGDVSSTQVATVDTPQRATRVDGDSVVGTDLDRSGATPETLLEPRVETPLYTSWSPATIGLLIFAGAVTIAFFGVLSRFFKVVRQLVELRAEQDSDEFTKALECWAPYLSGAIENNGEVDLTPRAIRRFLNRLRLYAMLNEEFKSTIPDAQLVALSVIDLRHPEWIGTALSSNLSETPWFDNGISFTSDQDVDLRQLEEKQNADWIRAYRGLTAGLA